jgi:osmotically-inducible protein OsmY
MKTDAQLRQDILAELKREPSVHATDIGVEVSDGVVTLAGQVGSYSEKWNAERVAQRVSGGKALAVEMDVKLPGSSRRNDTDIARSAESSLQWTTLQPKNAIGIKVEKGHVTLTGRVEWPVQRESALNAVRHLMGVTGVEDEIVIEREALTGTC